MPEIVRHKKTGGLYEVLFRGAQIQTNEPLADYAEVIVCRRVSDGGIVVRPASLPVPAGSVALYGGSVQANLPLASGDDVAVYRNQDDDMLVWVRPTAEMDDGRFEPADVPQATSADAIIREMFGRAIEEHGALADASDAVDALCDQVVDYVCTALLSHISTAVRGEGDGDLAALSAAASPGMLALSPRQYDDWGMIRTTELDSDGFCRVIFHSVILDDDAEKSAARSERRQPKIVKANSDFLIRLWNDYRSGRLVERSAATNPQDQE
ncbi:hypothetical protein [Methylobacterium aquaticum]|uniref:Uncharacterized protein n=1 Tax=Methylobacterium aquaticum TaxID=270351 RepID=A0A0C6FN18_9HYPH|nr:hypothetical protein [Methylobacterium aquaticum]BAQ44010.1 hypothetical protein Maq22A_c02745 [Methylobacterium aquaticum]